MNIALEFLRLGEFDRKENYLSHINEMVNIEIKADCTYNQLFDKLREKYKDDTLRLQAVEGWIKVNMDEQDEDLSVFDVPMWECDCYASFNFFKVKEHA